MFLTVWKDPVAYAFCFLTPAERNYAQIEEGEFSLDTESKEVPQLCVRKVLHSCDRP